MTENFDCQLRLILKTSIVCQGISKANLLDLWEYTYCMGRLEELKQETATAEAKKAASEAYWRTRVQNEIEAERLRRAALDEILDKSGLRAAIGILQESGKFFDYFNSSWYNRYMGHKEPVIHYIQKGLVGDGMLMGNIGFVWAHGGLDHMAQAIIEVHADGSIVFRGKENIIISREKWADDPKAVEAAFDRTLDSPSLHSVTGGGPSSSYVPPWDRGGYGI